MDHIQKNNLANIPIEWLETYGKNIKVGICDIGFDTNHKALKHAISEYKLFGGGCNKNHGTHVAGIIASKPNNISSVKGLAMESKLYLAGINTNANLGYKTLIEALKWILEINVDVLNLSFAYSERNKKIEELLQKIAENTLIVSSYSTDLSYPHKYEFVISAGIEDENADINYVGEFMSTSINNGYIKMSGSSMSTAFVSSVACLAKSYNSKITKEEFLSEIKGETKLDIRKNNNIIYGNRNNYLNIRFD